MWDETRSSALTQSGTWHVAHGTYMYYQYIWHPPPSLPTCLLNRYAALNKTCTVKISGVNSIALVDKIGKRECTEH